MLIALYPSKKVLKTRIGEKLAYVETSMFGEEYKANGTFAVCNRPSLPQGYKKRGDERVSEFFATVTMKNDRIEKVE